MAPLPNTIKREDIVKSINYEFISQFEYSINKLLEVLGITQRTPMPSGSHIIQYKYSVTPPPSEAAEGEDIPLTKVSQEKAREYDLIYKKSRKRVTAEAIQKSGFDAALLKTDQALLRELQKKIREEFFGVITGTSGATGSADNFQKAVAKAAALVRVNLEEADEIIVFANPMDVANYLGENNLNSQGAIFGLNVMGSWMDVKLFTYKDIPEGEVYATATGNLQMYYMDINGEVGDAFNMTTDETGLIGIIHRPVDDNMSYQTVTMSGIMLFADIAMGVAKVTIAASATPEPPEVP